MHRNSGPRSFMRRRALVVFTIGVICILSVSIFSQSRKQSRATTAEELEKMEPVLLGMKQYVTIPAGETVPVIVQFAESGEEDVDLTDSPEAQDRAERRMYARTRAVYESGGMPERAFSHLPVHTARVSREALDCLARDPRVAHVSIDHEVQGNLDKTAQAIGADQVWAGASTGIALTGDKVVVAVIDSGVDDGNYAWDLSGKVNPAVNFVGGGDLWTDIGDS